MRAGSVRSRPAHPIRRAPRNALVSTSGVARRSVSGPRPGWKPWRRLGAGLGIAATLASCSSIALLNTLEPRAGVRVLHDLRFKDGPRGTLDVYEPRSARGQAPVVVFIYGGSWDSGRKSQYAFVGEALASRGVLTVIPDYRLYPQARWPSFLQDNARAVRWACDHAAHYGGDPRRLFLLGHSAGAYDAVMLALDPRWLRAVGIDARRDLRGVIALAGPYDFLPLRSNELKAIFGPRAQRPATQPINYVTGRNAPLFLATDTADKFVEPGNTTRLAARLRATGGPVDVRYYRGLSHGLLLGTIAAPLRFLAPVLRDVMGFIHAQVAEHRLNPQPTSSSSPCC
jgi:acetyl esterase/lipase